MGKIIIKNISWLWLALILLVSACNQETTRELTGTTAERIVAVTRLLQDYGTVPGLIDDAQLIELQFGDNMLGPADFRSYIWIKVSTDDVRKWKSALSGALPSDPPIYDMPPSEPNWWLTKEHFQTLLKYDAFPMFQRHGWIVVDSKGNVYARTYTM